MKGFKYLFFTNKIKQPFYNFWFFKKLKGGEPEPPVPVDENLLTQPADYESAGIKWTWNEMSATGVGVASSNITQLTAITDLKETLVQGTSYTFSIKDKLTGFFRLTLIDGNGNDYYYDIMAGFTSTTFTSGRNYVKYYIEYRCGRNTSLNITIEDIKLKKAE